MSDADPDPTRVEPVVPAAGDPTSVFAAPGAGGPPGGRPPTHPPGGSAPDRRPWLVVALLAVIVVVLALILALRGDDDTSSTSTTETTSTSTSTSTTEPSTTTSEAAASTTTPVVTVPPAECAAAGERPSEPGFAARAVFDAWVRGDQPCAAELMAPAALAELFSRDGTGATDDFQGCFEVEEPDPHVDCAFTYPGGSTHYLMRHSPTDGWQVFDVTQVAD